MSSLPVWGHPLRSLLMCQEWECHDHRPLFYLSSPFLVLYSSNFLLQTQLFCFTCHHLVPSSPQPSNTLFTEHTHDNKTSLHIYGNYTFIENSIIYQHRFIITKVFTIVHEYKNYQHSLFYTQHIHHPFLYTLHLYPPLHTICVQ